MRPIRLLHTSDVHLGPETRDPSGRTHAADCICPVEVMAGLCAEHGVDVLLIAGDLFDHPRITDDLVNRTFELLAAVVATGTDVALMNGNHDRYGDNDPFRRHRSALDAAGVRFFDDPDGTSHDLAGGALRMWARHMDDHHPRWLPLADPPPRPADSWYVVGAHGHLTVAAELGQRSSPILTDHIDATEADYVALGHWHVTTDVGARGATVPAWYSGATLFGHGAGNVLIVDLVPGEAVSVQPVSVLDHHRIVCG